MSPDPDIDHGGALWRDDVGTQAAVYRADVDGDTAFGVVQGEQALYHVRKFQDRAGPGVGIESCMCRASVHGDSEPADAFSRGFQITIRSERGLKDENPFADACNAPNVAGRFAAADFLVRIQKNNGSQCWPETEFTDGSQCKQHLRDAAFHIVHSGAVHNVLLALERH
ncbi:MAG: hypothetical protein P8X53_03905 [Chromatiales bacterium]